MWKRFFRWTSSPKNTPLFMLLKPSTTARAAERLVEEEELRQAVTTMSGLLSVSMQLRAARLNARYLPGSMALALLSLVVSAFAIPELAKQLRRLI